MNNTVDDVMGGAHDVSSHDDDNMFLYYLSLWQHRDCPSGLAVESPCRVPVRSTVTLCKDRTRHKEFRSGGLTRNARERRGQVKKRRRRRR